MSRTAWVVGNWKQWGLRAPARSLARAVAEGLAVPEGLQVALAPPYLALDAAVEAVSGSPVSCFVQDVAAQDEGAFTGEVGPAMVREAGARGAIVGHSERRWIYGETDALVAAKVASALSAGLWTILCVGEPLEVREAGTAEAFVLDQLAAGLAQVEPAACERLVVAYEPVWAIGTGRTARPEDAQAVHAAIRRWLRTWGGAAAADRSVLYGGSVKPHNAADLFAGPDVDGFLVGGASKDAAAFRSIVHTVARTLESPP